MLTFRQRSADLGLTALLIVAASLAACGGGGYGGGGGGMYVPPGVGASKLFAADSTDKAVGSLANPDPAAGSLTVDRTITGPVYVNLSNNIGSLALDTTRDYLYVGNGTSIVVFHSASMQNGDVLRGATISSIGNTGSMFLDATHDRLYVGDDVNNVKVFSPASTANGTPMPRLVTGMTTPIHGVAVDVANDILYVSNESSGTHQISVFNSASSVTTALPDRVIVPTASTINLPVAGISLDASHHLLYVAPGAGSGDIRVFDDSAHTANNMVAPTKTLTIASAPGILSVLVDSVNDRLYAVGSTGHIYLIEMVSTLSTGTATAKDASLSSGSMLTAVAVNPN